MGVREKDVPMELNIEFMKVRNTSLKSEENVS